MSDIIRKYMHKLLENIWDKYDDDIIVPEEEFNYEYYL
jgi:hypothetical protein